MTTPHEHRSPAGRRPEILQLLRDEGAPLGISDIAVRLGIHPNTVRLHLDTLVGTGQVERTTARSGAPGRPPQVFRALRRMDPTGPRHYQALAEVLVATLAADPDPGGRGLQAGRAWGMRRASASTDPGADDAHGEPAAAAVSATDADADPVTRLMSLLDEMGFAPEELADGDDTRIGLRQCPFLELAVDGREVVCPVHLGLMQGALATWAAPVTVDQLEAFVEPDLCVAHLRSAGAA
jgi:predicted ArsR family transcriptional regulator